jgi:hypothetical protein
MKQLFSLLLLFLLSATVASARPKGTVRCETDPKDTKADVLMVTCPPLSVFSPIRVRFSLASIDKHGWAGLDLSTAHRVKLLIKPQKILLFLPHREHDHQWKAWREFKKVKQITIFQGNPK